MKNLLLFFLLFFSTISFAQTDTTFFDVDWKACSKTEASYYRIVTKQGIDYKVKDMYLKTDIPQMIAVCSALEPLYKNGLCAFYSESGQKTSEGNYVNNKQMGIWINWDEDGKDSSVIEFFADSSYKNIHISATNKTVNDKYDFYYPYEIMPEYIGGIGAMSEFIIQHVKYPKYERNHGVSGTCYVTFVVEKDGSVTDVRILRGVAGGPGCDKEALRVINLMPKWKPGIQGGRIVRVQFNLPIKFTLRNSW